MEAASFLKYNDKVLVNFKNIDHLKQIEFIKIHEPNYTFFCADIERCLSHIDGHLHYLGNNTFLTKVDNIEKYYRCLKNKNIIRVYEDSINILSYKNNHFITKDSFELIDIFKRLNLNYVECELDDSMFYKGGIHCATLEF